MWQDLTHTQRTVLVAFPRVTMNHRTNRLQYKEEKLASRYHPHTDCNGANFSLEQYDEQNCPVYNNNNIDLVISFLEFTLIVPE